MCSSTHCTLYAPAGQRLVFAQNQRFRSRRHAVPSDDKGSSIWCDRQRGSRAVRSLGAGAAAALRQETGGRTLEDTFIALTGHSIREAEAVPVDRCT
jgi:hypothetical protein